VPNDVDLWEVFALDEETDEPDPAYGDFWIDPQPDEAEDER
jgi:hypothetical protein